MSSSSSPRRSVASFLVAAAHLVEDCVGRTPQPKEHRGLHLLVLRAPARAVVALAAAQAMPSPVLLVAARRWVARQRQPAALAVLYPSADGWDAPRVHLLWRRGTEFETEVPHARLATGEVGGLGFVDDTGRGVYATGADAAYCACWFSETADLAADHAAGDAAWRAALHRAGLATGEVA